MDAARWIESYGRAWEDADAAAAAALFTPDAVYRSHPFRQPHEGTEGIERYWRGATATQRDIRVRFGEPLVDGTRAAVEWWATMEEEDGPITLPGILVLRFGHGGLCEELRECWAVAEGFVEPYPGWGRTGGPGGEARPAAAEWIDGYTRAWTALDPEMVGVLFSEDGVYRSHPFRPARVGREGALAYTREAFADEADPRVHFGRPVCQGSAAAVEYWAVLVEDGVPSTLTGCDVLLFDHDGRCRELRENWHLEPGEREPPPGWGA